VDVDFSSQSPGTYYWTVTACDYAGNCVNYGCTRFYYGPNQSGIPSPRRCNCERPIIHIKSCNELRKIGWDNNYPIYGYYILDNNIVCDNVLPIGCKLDNGHTYPLTCKIFAGILDGNGHKITIKKVITTPSRCLVPVPYETEEWTYNSGTCGCVVYGLFYGTGAYRTVKNNKVCVYNAVIKNLVVDTNNTCLFYYAYPWVFYTTYYSCKAYGVIPPIFKNITTNGCLVNEMVGAILENVNLVDNNKKLGNLNLLMTLNYPNFEHYAPVIPLTTKCGNFYSNPVVRINNIECIYECVEKNGKWICSFNDNNCENLINKTLIINYIDNFGPYKKYDCLESDNWKPSDWPYNLEAYCCK
jgi:hypothetical protein